MSPGCSILGSYAFSCFLTHGGTLDFLENTPGVSACYPFPILRPSEGIQGGRGRSTQGGSMQMAVGSDAGDSLGARDVDPV
jgi:hypothetical protein